MGGSHWSEEAYTTRIADRVATRGTAFAHDKDVRTGAAPAKAHNLLDPKDLKVRESRDSAAHPESNAIMVWLDVTGSMGSVVGTIHKKLPTLMGILTRKAYIPDPQILFGAIGDATNSPSPADKAPLQVGQFESGDEMEGDLSNFYIEGGGGGQNPPQESYELAAYVGARKTSIDCFEKRGKKGYCFIIGDERPYPNVRKDIITKLIGPELEADISTKEIFRELQEKYVTFFILPKGASHGGSIDELRRVWGEYIDPQHILALEDPAAAPELIATQIGLYEGSTDMDSAAKDLEEHGTSKALVSVIRSSVSKAYSGGQIAKIAAGSLVTSGTDPVKRL
jgi:hypothetical protein